MTTPAPRRRAALHTDAYPSSRREAGTSSPSGSESGNPDSCRKWTCRSRRDLPSAVGEQINPIMMVVLHDTQRGMEHQPVQQVGELAQSAADALRRLPTLDHEPFAVALPRRGRSHEPPERKDFARPDEHARHFRRGKPQIDGLVFLEPHVHVAEPPPDERGMAICQYRKRLFPPRPGKGAGAAQILQMPERNALPARKLVCKRAQITKQLTRHRPPPP